MKLAPQLDPEPARCGRTARPAPRRQLAALFNTPFFTLLSPLATSPSPACPETATGNRKLSPFLAADPITLPFKLFSCHTSEKNPKGPPLFFYSPRLCASARDSIFAAVPHQPADSTHLPNSSFCKSPIFNAMLRHPGWGATFRITTHARERRTLVLSTRSAFDE